MQIVQSLGTIKNYNIKSSGHQLQQIYGLPHIYKLHICAN